MHVFVIRFNYIGTHPHISCVCMGECIPVKFAKLKSASDTKLLKHFNLITLKCKEAEDE